MLEGFDVVVGEDGGELIAAIERQDGIQGVKLLGTLEDGIGRNCGQGAFGHQKGPESGSERGRSGRDLLRLYPV